MPPPRILVIDDDINVLKYIADTLSRAGFDTDTAVNTDVGISLFGQHTHPLVITDIIMPEREGIDTVLSIKRLNPATKVLAISGGGMIQAQDLLVIAGHIGADRTLSKPFKRAQLLTLVHELLCLAEAE